MPPAAAEQAAAKERLAKVRANTRANFETVWKTNKCLFVSTWSPQCLWPCIPPTVSAVHPTPADATISFPGTTQTALDARYLARREKVGEHTLQRPDGRVLSYFVDDGGAAASATPVLLLHGAGSCKLRWMQKAPLPGMRLIAIDRPGFGNSTPMPPLAPAELIASFLADVEALCEALGVGTLLVCGHSFGCTWAMALAASWPARVLGVILFSPPRRLAAPFPPPMASFFANRSLALLTGAALAISRSRGQLQAAEGEQRETPERYAAFAADPFWVSVMFESQHCFLSDKAVALGTVNDNALIGAPRLPFDEIDETVLACPLHLYVGAADSLTPLANAQLLAQKLPHAQLRVIDGCAHILAVGPSDDFRRRLCASAQAMLDGAKKKGGGERARDGEAGGGCAIS